LVVNQGVSVPKPSLIKAMLINAARDLQPAGCDYTFEVDQTEVHEGWGFVQAVDTLYGPSGTPSNRRIEFENEVTANAVAASEQYQRQVTANAGTRLKVTLAWTDYPATAGSGSPLVVNDLDLEVSGPDGTFLGNNFSGHWSVTGGTADRYNVVENVYIQSPTGGTYTITIKGYQVSQDQEPDKSGINQDFSLVWSGNLGCTTNEQCNDGNECTEDLCVGGVCQNNPVPDNTSCTVGGTICCSGTCVDPACSANPDCDDAEDCTTDTCLNPGICAAVCENTWPACGPADGCCVPTCTPANDPDCVYCGDGECAGQADEDCNSCPADCISGGGAACPNGRCEPDAGENCHNCPEDCNGKQTGAPQTRFCCGDDVDCTDSRCTSEGYDCGPPMAEYCCGDYVCEGAETVENCAVDCGCTGPEDCDDLVGCTDDDCVEGAASIRPTMRIARMTVCSAMALSTVIP
jgi:hypothetical protein